MSESTLKPELDPDWKSWSLETTVIVNPAPGLRPSTWEGFWLVTEPRLESCVVARSVPIELVKVEVVVDVIVTVIG